MSLPTPGAIAPNPRGRDARTIALAVKALELRKDGYSYRQVAKMLGVSPGHVHTLVHEQMAELRQTAISLAADIQDLEVERLDDMFRSVWWQATKGRRLDRPPAIQTVLKIMERRAKLLGLDAPTQITVAVMMMVLREVTDEQLAIEAQRRLDLVEGESDDG